MAVDHTCLFCWRPTVTLWRVQGVKGNIPMCGDCRMRFCPQTPAEKRLTASDVRTQLKDLAEMGMTP